MKRFLSILAICLLSASVSTAQNGKFIASEDFAKCVKGTWALGYQATLHHRSDLEFQSGLYTKYFITDKWALRGNVRFGRDYAKGTDPEYLVDNENMYINNDDLYTEEGEEQNTVIRKSNFMLVVGAEHRHKLSNRFFGYYGADLGVGGYGQIYKEFDANGELLSQRKRNRCCDLTIQPFIGLEFFVGQRISLGMEAGYDVLFKFYRKGESYSNNGNKITEQKYSQYTSLSSHIDFGNCVFGTAKIAFYF